MPATVLPAEAAPPEEIHNCPQCSHWLPEGTLACPDCGTLVYAGHLSQLAAAAQAAGSEGNWIEARTRWAEALRWVPEGSPQEASVREQVAKVDARLRAEEDRKAKWTKRLGPFAPIAFFLLKFKSALFLLLKAKALLSLVAFFGVYWALFGWRFALGFTGCIFVHEMGHFFEVKRRGLKADLPVFFPGLGAYVRWYSQGVNVEGLATIALMGPVFGLLASLACLAAGFFLRSPILLVIANVGAWINFFNLLPVLGLDGAQATYALSKLQRGLVAAICVLFFGLTVSASGGELFAPQTQWIFLIVGAGMAYRVFTSDEPPQPSTRTFLGFLGLVLALGLLLIKTNGIGM